MTRALERGLKQVQKNYIINGGMQISQENGANAGTTSGYYAADQWLMDLSLSGGAVSFGQVTSRTPLGSPNRLRVTVTTAQASIGAGYCIIRQPLEGARIADLLGGTATAKTIVAQFGVKGPAGTYQAGIPAGDFGITVNGTFTISAGEANTDVYKTIILQLPTSGNYTTGSAAGAHFQVVLAQNTQFNLIGTNGNVFELFDVGVYEGTTAPAFQLPDLVSELQLCRRYWEKSYDYATGVTASVPNGAENFFVNTTGSTANGGALAPRFKVSKRATPTMTIYSDATGASGKLRDRTNSADVTPTVDSIGENGCRVFAATTANVGTALSCHWTSNARM
jgi:hypothetical protein